MLCFIDDCLIFSPQDFDLHLSRLESVLIRVKGANMRLKLEKCQFAYPEVNFLGHIVGRFGLKMDMKKVEKLKSLVAPTSKTSLKSFLGLAGYFRNFIPEFAEIGYPLFQLLKKKQPTNFSLNPEQLQSFQLLVAKITEYPVLQFPDFSHPFIVETDASKRKVAAVLLQEKEGNKNLISCASRSLSTSEANYSIVELEALAIVWGIRYFRPYLYGTTFFLLQTMIVCSFCIPSRIPTAELSDGQ